MHGRARRMSAFLLAALLLVSGCGAAPPRMGPQGVDQLRIPSPSPDPADFAAVVDNPWLPLAPGATWTYDAAGDPVVVRVVDRVAEETEEIAGIAATGLVRSEYDDAGTLVAERTSWLAQDRRGNVWLLGRDDPAGSWRAGDRSAPAGLMMPAAPRLGDGFVVAQAPADEQVATVVDLRAEVEVPAGRYDEGLEIETRTPGDPTRRGSTTYVSGVGVVRESRSPGGRLLELTEPETR